MSWQQLLYKVEDRVATITLNRPDRLNAYTPVMSGELREAFAAADADDEVRAIVLKQVYEALFQSLAEATAVANREQPLCRDTEDFREGVRSYVEKRAPSFTGR